MKILQILKLGDGAYVTIMQHHDIFYVYSYTLCVCFHCNVETPRCLVNWCNVLRSVVERIRSTSQVNIIDEIPSLKSGYATAIAVWTTWVMW